MNIRTITLLATVMVLTAVFVGVAAWVGLQVRGERMAIEELAAELATVEQRASYASSLRTLARDTAADRAAFTALVSGTSAVATIQQFESAGVTAGATVSVEAVQPAEIAAQGNQTVSALALSIRATGSFPSLFHLLQLFESLPGVTEVDVFTLEASQQESGVSWTLTTRVRVLSDQTEL